MDPVVFGGCQLDWAGLRYPGWAGLGRLWGRLCCVGAPCHFHFQPWDVLEIAGAPALACASCGATCNGV